MKAIQASARIIAFLAVLPLLLLSACDKYEPMHSVTYNYRVPVYLSISVLRAQVIAKQEPQKLSQPGKIYIYNQYLFINEINKGIHVVDNSNPSSPRFVSFIAIPGNADFAVNSNILYADTYTDLLAFDISNPSDIKMVKRVEDVFEGMYSDKANGMVIGYRDSIITRIEKKSSQQMWMAMDNGASAMSASYSANSQSYGTGGSTARFALMNSNLYTVDKSRLKLFNVSIPAIPKFINQTLIGGGIETIFPYENKLFIGSTTGMHIYDASNASAPVKLSTYRHITSCDPVIVQGKYAYVTLRSGTFCQVGTNVLDVLNIEDPVHPVKVSSFPMLNPHGLTISGTTLYICEGQHGLKAFDSSDVLKIGNKQFSFLTDIEAADIIAGPKSLIVTGSKGIYQYDYSNPSALQRLSHLGLNTAL
jgi:hypothetical protein